MHRPDLEALIADQPLQEYRPAGYHELSTYRLAWLRVCWGYQGWGRRVWIDPLPGAEILATGATIEKLHCAEDARAIVESSRPMPPVLAELSSLDPVISEPAHPPARILRWQIGDLIFENRTSPVGSGLVLSALVVGRGASAIGSRVDSLMHEITQLVAGTTKEAGRCSYGLRRYLWSFLASVIFLIPAIFVPGTLAFEFLPDPVPIFVIIGAAFFSTYVFTRWSQHNRLQQQRKVWGAVLTQGDSDGTIRRALASIGIELPEAPAPSS